MKASDPRFKREALLVRFYVVGLVLLVVGGITINVLVKGPDSVRLLPPPDVSNIPIYPGARNVSRREDIYLPSVPLGPTSPESGRDKGTRIAFDTADGPDMVLAYYRTKMHEEDWTLVKLDEAAGQNQLFFVYVDRIGRHYSAPYDVYLRAEVTSQGNTKVELFVRQ
jgi:hypothetical protein